jgi:GxxExxY protein
VPHDGNNYRGGRAGSNAGRGGRGPNDYAPRDQFNDRRGIPLSDLDPKLTEASRRLIGCAIEVHKAMGAGYESAHYLEALKAELDANGVTYKANHAFPVKYREREVGQVRADLFVDDLFLVKLMARPGPITIERIDLRAQLKAADLDLGLIVNFAQKRLKEGLVRVLNVEKLNIKGVKIDGDDLDQGGDFGDRVPEFDA